MVVHDMMLLSRLLVMEFGVFLLAALGLLTRQVVRGWMGQGGLRLSAEGAVLLAGAVATCSAYGLELARAGGDRMPGVSGVWVGVFAASCGMHVAMKAVRNLRRR